MNGTRVTDVVRYFANRGEDRGAVRVIRSRTPDQRRWRNAVSSLTKLAGDRRGMERMRVEEPVRELVLSLDSSSLRKEVVLDARRNNVDLDRGEILPTRFLYELNEFATESKLDLEVVHQHVALPGDEQAPIDCAAVVLVGRAVADFYRRRSFRQMLEIPSIEEGELDAHFRVMLERANRDADVASRWEDLSKSLLAFDGEVEKDAPEDARFF